MKKTDKNKLKSMVEKLQSFTDDLEQIIQSEDERLSLMDTRQRLLGFKEDIITSNKINMDIARILLNDSIEEISKVLER